MSDVPPPPAPPQSPTAPPPPPGYGATPAGEPPLDQPYYGAPLPVAVRRFFTKYAVFSGRASRAEYWWWALISYVINIVLNSLGRIDGATGTTFDVIEGIWGLAIIVPSLALLWRRLHDANHSGLNFLWVFLPIIGWIILLVFVIQGPRPEGARFDR